MFLRQRKETPPHPPFLIIGLGNPGPEYKLNRHNVGFMVLDELAKELDAAFGRMQANALVAAARHREQRLVLAKPRTFMNLSGSAVGGLLRFYKTPLERLLIIYDDADLPFENLRLRPDGGSAGQKGMKSIIENLGSENFARLRVGIGRPKGRMKTPDHVLQDFSRSEQQALPFVLQRAAQAALTFVDDGIDAAMNRFNPKEK
ncbi:MAG TPA: aminoacyl-tRNA hydrolase [Anaerolineales bacterium]|nr:aminoacyl-tRNA hydrolase [Anaerolineales bacterium]